MNFSNLGGMAASDCDDVMVVGPEAGNDFEDSIIAVSLFQKKRMNVTTLAQVAIKELTDYQIYSEHQKTTKAFRFQMLVKRANQYSNIGK